jgi:dCMP deaminase
MSFFIRSKPMTKWDQRFCELAKFVAEWSKDPSAKVGAVIVSRRGGDVTVGYNGLPMGVEDTDARLQDKEVKLEMIVHAEVNAIVAAGLRAQNSTLYVWGKPICARCAGPIIQSGVKRVVALSPEAGAADSKWRKTGETALNMMKEVEIEIDLYEVLDEPERTGDAPAPENMLSRLDDPTL